MKNNIRIFLSMMVLAAGAAACSTPAATAELHKTERADVKAMVSAQNYVFVAQSAMPMRGRVRQLTPDYTLKVAKDSVVSTLPYFGRAYTAPMDPNKIGLEFTTRKFSYSQKDRNKGGWDITILPKDNRDVQQLFLTISEDGYGTLQVTSNNRQPITFNGYIKQR